MTRGFHPEISTVRMDIDLSRQGSYARGMRSRVASLFVVGALGLSGLGGIAGAAQAHSVAAAKTCSAGYVSANLPWGHKCLRAGEYCKVGNKAYLKYGYYCPKTGHLKRRG